MYQSQLFTKTSKQIPEGEASKNAQLLIRGGFINKSSAGVYTLLPLGLRVLDRVNKIIREEMNAIGGQELLMPSLIQKKYWEQAGRWDVDIIYKTGIKEANDYGLGWTHEEVIAGIATHFINSYKDLPKAVYQIQTKFRAEPRAQAGILRGREFLMKDLYSFHTSKEDLDKYYEIVSRAYTKVFKRLGLKTYICQTGGGAFTKEYTHEFQVINPAGEDTIYYCPKCDFCQNQEIYNAAMHENCDGEIESARAIEVGNIFKLGTKFSDAFNLQYLDNQGNKNKVIMGSYGIGPTRVMGTIVEEYNDEKGIIWPESVAPFDVHLIELSGKEDVKSDKVRKSAMKIYQDLQKAGVEVLYDERNVSAGEKLNDADLIGASLRVVVSEKTVASEKIEVKRRSEKNNKLITPSQLLKEIKR